MLRLPENTIQDKARGDALLLLVPSPADILALQKLNLDAVLMGVDPETLRGRHVAILYRRGRRYEAAAVALRERLRPIAATVIAADLPMRTRGEGVAEWLAREPDPRGTLLFYLSQFDTSPPAAPATPPRPAPSPTRRPPPLREIRKRKGRHRVTIVRVEITAEGEVRA